MLKNIEYKLERLKDILKKMKRVVIAYSGGVDTTFLMKVAKDNCDYVLAITCDSILEAKEDIEFSKIMANELSIPHRIIKYNALDVPQIKYNTRDRCYYCKKTLYNKIKEVAENENIEYILDGTIVDDLSDYRPGLKAIKEMNIFTPLADVGFTKKEIRELSKELNLPTYNKPSNTCLASRFPYNDEITEEKLNMVYECEKFLSKFIKGNLRVRHHGFIARIEVDDENFSFLLEKSIREKIVDKFNKIGYKYVAIDLKCYRCGSMNE